MADIGTQEALGPEESSQATSMGETGVSPRKIGRARTRQHSTSRFSLLGLHHQEDRKTSHCKTRFWTGSRKEKVKLDRERSRSCREREKKISKVEQRILHQMKVIEQ